MTSTNENKKKKGPIYWKNQEPPKEGVVFKDPEFPPTANSLLGIDKNGNIVDSKAYSEKSKNIKTNEIGFFRPNEIFGDNYCLFSNKIEMGDVQQGSLGDCYFLSSVANICKFPNMVQKLFKQTTKNKDGYYEIFFFIDGKRQIVIVDDYLPAYKKNKSPCYAQTKKEEKEIWVMLLEKAWAKVNGGYANIISGLPCEAMEALTGSGSLIYDLENLDGADVEDYKYEIVKNVQLADQNNSLITCSTISDPNIERVGLVDGHAYTVISFNKIQTSQGKDVFLFRIRNPWSQGEWTGDWSDASKLWDAKAKSQVKFENKDEGIFFMNDTDFFKYFTHVEICYTFFDSQVVSYTIEDQDSLKNANVFNIETEGEGFLSVSIPRESWRANRTLRDKVLPTHISIVQYDPNARSRLKTFSNYNGTFESFRTCTLNARVTKGNYLIYVYRDYENAGYNAERKMEVKIVCSTKFKHAQMANDDRDKGFPLLQNIILQAVFKENNYNPDSGDDFNSNGNQLKGNGIGYIIFYKSTPGYYIDFTGGTAKVKNYIMLTPYLDKKTTTFHRAIPSGKYLIFLGLMNGIYGAYSFNCFTKAYTTNKKLTLKFDNNEIDLTLYTDMNNNIQNPNFRQRKTQSLERAKQEYYGEITDGKIQYKTLAELQKQYAEQLQLLDEIDMEETNKNLKWGIIVGEYVTYVGQFNGDKKEGKGLLINPSNIFAGTFNNDQQHGKGYTYNKNLEKLFYCIYENGQKKGKSVSVEQELEEIEKAKQQAEEEMKKEQERLKKIEEEKEALLKKQEEERKKKEEELALALQKAEEERKKKEEEAALALKKAEEAALAEKKRLEEERQKELERQKAELERIAKEEQEKLEEAKRKAEELKKEEERKAQELKQKAEEELKKEQERIKQEIENMANQATDEAAKAKKELEEKQEKMEKEAQEKIEQAKQQMEEAQKKAEEEAKRLQEQVQKKIEEEKNRIEQKKKEAEEKAKKLQEEAEKKAEEEKKKVQEMKEEAEKKAEQIKQEAEKKAEEAKQQVENIKNQMQQTRDNAQKLADNLEQRRKFLEERQRRNRERRKQQLEQMKQDVNNGAYGNQIIYPDYMINRTKQTNNLGDFSLQQEVMEMCTTCGCNIF